MEEWPFSSFRDYAGIHKGSLCNKEAGFLITGTKEDDFVKESYEVMADAIKL
jgi:hypothetical protein